MNIKFKYFLINAKELYDNFNIIPLLYGSLGLEVLTSTNLNADDIDILISEIFVNGPRWNEFKNRLENNGYVLIDEDEHTFRKDNIDYSYASIENLWEFANININDIKKYEANNTHYLLLSLEQYLKVYQKSSLDGYRMNKKEKKDNEKIKFINKCLENSSNHNKKLL